MDGMTALDFFQLVQALRPEVDDKLADMPPDTRDWPDAATDSLVAAILTAAFDRTGIIVVANQVGGPPPNQVTNKIAHEGFARGVRDWEDDHPDPRLGR